MDGGFLDGLSGANNIVYSVALQNDGKVVLGGDFRSVNGEERNRIARLNADGTLDSGFLHGLSGVLGGVETSVYAIALQQDGKVVIGGQFAAINNVIRPFLGRVHPDGTLDQGFLNRLFGPDNIVNSVAVQSDGKVLIGGVFREVNGLSRPGIARLNADGALDTGFGNGLAGANNIVSAIAVQSDGKILIGGHFGLVHGMSRHGIARLNPDGTLDVSFQNGFAGSSHSVSAVAVQSDGKVLIGGAFSGVNGLPAAHIARLWGSADVPPLIKSITYHSEGAKLMWDALPNRTYRVQYKTNLLANTWTDLAGDVPATGGAASKTDTTLGTTPQRFYQVLLVP